MPEQPQTDAPQDAPAEPRSDVAAPSPAPPATGGAATNAVSPPPAAPAIGGAATNAVPALEPTAFYGLLKVVVSDISLTPDQKKMLIDELRKSTPASDRWTFRWAIWILGLVVVLTIIALWSLSAGKSTIPDGLVAIGSAAAGGLAGLLTPGRGRDQ